MAPSASYVQTVGAWKKGGWLKIQGGPIATVVGEAAAMGRNQRPPKRHMAVDVGSDLQGLTPAAINRADS
jgi:hypothetical protein